MNRKKNIWWLVGALVILIVEFIPTNRPPVIGNNPADLIQTAPVPAKVAKLLQSSCYDCHSNETTYPWYAYVAPVSWLVNSDIREGRKKVNFSNWEQLTIKKKSKILDNISDEVSEGGMPLFIYPFMHKKAKLTAADRKLIVVWADAYGKQLFNNK